MGDTVLTIRPFRFAFLLGIGAFMVYHFGWSVLILYTLSHFDIELR